jgi:NTE family protein
MIRISTNTLLALGGGNALGAFQAGVLQALDEKGTQPAWIAGASIGAINACLFAGNSPQDRIARLRAFWHQAEQLPKRQPDERDPAPAPRVLRDAAVFRTLATGRPGLFAPNLPFPFGPGGTRPAMSLFRHDALPDTLRRFIDFDRLNAGEPRITVTAIDVESGEDVVFDTTNTRIEPEHLQASASFLPAYPPVEIAGRLLADPGHSANLPIQAILSDAVETDTTCIAVDLVSAQAARPVTFGDAAKRALDLILSSQSRHAILRLQESHRLRSAATRRGTAPEGAAEPTSGAADRTGGSKAARITLLHLVYAEQGQESAGKMLDYSARSIAERWSKGYEALHEGLQRLSSTTCSPGSRFTAYRFDGRNLTAY